MPETDLNKLRLPSLNPAIKLYETGTDSNGSPIWRIYNPVAHKYYQLSWAEFECLTRFQDCETAQDLKEKINKETTLIIEDQDVVNLITFLNKNGLLSSKDSFSGSYEAPRKQPLWKKMLHHYLFFTIPLFKPEGFLRSTYNFVRPILSKGFFRFSMIILFIGLLMTIGRIDEFLHTFFMFFSLEGAITIFVTFFFIKILHEFGHAYTAHQYGVRVPHMGVAFMVMYPVLYTETSGAWQIKSKDQRMHIGLAGIRTELILAAYALILWHFLPPGMLQSLCFSIVAISLIGSLLINLNPTMRFDGYFVLSDYMGIENMHARGFAAARWWLRKKLFGLQDDIPEDNEKHMKFLIVFGFATLLYRFTLFLGIALLVYHLFFKPLGLILMIIELLWFIFIPLFSELKIWWERRGEIISHKKGRITLGLCLVFIIVFILPSSNTTTLPAILHSETTRALYPPAPSIITDIHVTNGQSINEGRPILTLTSPALEKELALEKTNLESLLAERKSFQSAPDKSTAKERLSSIDTEISAAKEQIQSLEARMDKLTITAPFDGIIRDLDHNLYIGQTVSADYLLGRVTQNNHLSLSAYASEHQIRTMAENNKAYFRPDSALFGSLAFTVSDISTVNINDLDWPELASVYGGPLPSEFSSDQSGKSLTIPRQSLYKIRLTPQENMKAPAASDHNFTARKGRVKIKTARKSPALESLRAITKLAREELSLN